MTWIDFYILQRKDDVPQDFKAALALVAGDDDAEYFIEGIAERFQKGPVSDDADELGTFNGKPAFILQYHNGVGDGGAQDICNAQWFANAHPAAFKLLGVTISWGKGTKALQGNPDGSV